MNSLYYTFKLVELTERENNICISKIAGQIARSFGFKIKIYRIDTLKKFLKNKILELENDIRDSKTKEFIKNARNIHGFRYNYSKVKYNNSTTDVIIICAKHGEFPQRPGNHIKKKPCNCPKCSGKYKPTTEEFISKCKKKYPNKFDYSEVIYVNQKTKITLKCLTCNNYIYPTADRHLNSGGCSICYGHFKHTTEEFIEKAEKEHVDEKGYSIYDYSKVKYESSKTDVIIICKIHGEFLQKPYVHLAGHGCRKCAPNYSPDKKEFIEKVEKIHVDEQGNSIYDYSNVEYENCDTNIIIICRIHGEFLQTPTAHVQGQGCPTCGRLRTGNKLRSNTKEFIEKAEKEHVDENGDSIYDYSQVEYEKCDTNIIIICRIHGEFLQTPNSHLNGHGCTDCGNLKISIIKKEYFKSTTSNKEAFEEKAIKKHGNKYNYSKVDYKDSSTNVIISCKDHGDFIQTPSSHLISFGCFECMLKNRRIITNKPTQIKNEFIKVAYEIHGEKYDYSKMEDSFNSKKYQTIICKKHGEFKQIPRDHLQGHGCVKCSGRYQYSPEEYIIKAKQIHGDSKFDYSKTYYVNAFLNVIVGCKEHGSFEIKACSHLRGSECSLCKNKTEGKLYNFLLSEYINSNIIKQYKNEFCKNKRLLPFDFLLIINNVKIIIELDGLQHFKQIMNWQSNDKTRKIDVYKMIKATENNHHVIRLFQPDIWNDAFDWRNWLKIKIKDILDNYIDNFLPHFPDGEEKEYIYKYHEEDYNNYDEDYYDYDYDDDEDDTPTKTSY